MKIKRQYIYVTAAILCWGMSATISKLILQEIDAMVVVAISFAVSTLSLFIYMMISGKIKSLRRVTAIEVLKMTLIGLLGVLLYNVFYLLGIDALQAQQAFVINYLWPALIIVCSAVILGEKLNPGKIIAVISSFLGVAVVTTNGDFHGFLASINFKGILYCILAAVCYALYSTLSKRESYDKEIATFVAYVTGTLLAFLLVLIQGKEMHISFGVMGGLVFYGVVCNSVPYLSWILALEYGDTAVIANLVYLTPFVSLLMTHFVLGEKVTIFSVIGLVLIVGGILIQMTVQKKDERR